MRPSSARRAPPKPKKAEFSSEETVSGSVSCLIPALTDHHCWLTSLLALQVVTYTHTYRHLVTCRIVKRKA